MTLLERVKELRAPDREVDLELMRLFEPSSFIDHLYTCTLSEGSERELSETNNAWCIYIKSGSGGGAGGGHTKYTASIEAAIALVERVRPGWHWTIYGPNGKDSTVCFDPPILSKRANVWATAATPALALLTALLHSIPVQGD